MFMPLSIPFLKFFQLFLLSLKTKAEQLLGSHFYNKSNVIIVPAAPLSIRSARTIARTLTAFEGFLLLNIFISLFYLNLLCGDILFTKKNARCRNLYLSVSLICIRVLILIFLKHLCYYLILLKIHGKYSCTH